MNIHQSEEIIRKIALGAGNVAIFFAMQRRL
jgi:hypothetical protein